MKPRIVYYSATGNTRKVAEAIAAGLGDGVVAEAIGPDTTVDGADTLFIGAAVYATHDHGIHESVRSFIAGLDPSKTGRAVLFSTGFVQSDAIPMMRRLLEARGITVARDSFFCLGRFALFNLGRPNAADLTKARDFGARMAAVGD